MKTVLVTGTSSGIGRATALRLAADGYRVLAGVRDPADGTPLRAESNGSRGEIEPVVLDVTKPDTIEAAVGRAKELTDRDGLTGVINNAGQPVTGPMEVLPIDELRHELEVNLIGQIAVTQAFLPMLRATEGRIVFISSIGGQVVFPFAGAYHASKFGLEAAAEALRPSCAEPESTWRSSSPASPTRGSGRRRSSRRRRWSPSCRHRSGTSTRRT